uniref:Uncharacterized protein n=1 Tax=Rhizophora mucronata TaxID=61149 RepID=A0A2P2IRH9_RHIMU
MNCCSLPQSANDVVAVGCRSPLVHFGIRFLLHPLRNVVRAKTATSTKTSSSSFSSSLVSRAAVVIALINCLRLPK